MFKRHPAIFWMTELLIISSLLCFLLLQEYQNNVKTEEEQRKIDESVSSLVFCNQ